jgi:hypothetical protein
MEQIKKYWREICLVLLVIALLCMSQCEPDDIKSDKKELEKVLDCVKVMQDKHKKLVDSIKKEDAKKDVRIAELQTNNTELKTVISESKKQLKEKQKVISTFTIAQSAEYLAQRYNTTTDVVAENNSVSLKKDVPSFVIMELEEKDMLKGEVIHYEKIIDNKDEEIKLEKEKTLNKVLEIASKEMEAENLEKGLNLALDLKNKTDKENKKLKRNNFLTTYIVPPLVFVGGVLIGRGITK